MIHTFHHTHRSRRHVSKEIGLHQPLNLYSADLSLVAYRQKANTLFRSLRWFVRMVSVKEEPPEH